MIYPLMVGTITYLAPLHKFHCQDFPCCQFLEHSIKYPFHTHDYNFLGLCIYFLIQCQQDAVTWWHWHCHHLSLIYKMTDSFMIPFHKITFTRKTLTCSPHICNGLEKTTIIRTKCLPDNYIHTLMIWGIRTPCLWEKLLAVRSALSASWIKSGTTSNTFSILQNISQTLTKPCRDQNICANGQQR